MRSVIVRACLLLALGAAALGAATVAQADHAWGDPPYHWSKSGTEVSLTVMTHLSTSNWHAALNTAFSDWNASPVINLTKATGSTSSFTRRLCRPTAGRIDVCNYTYGKNGWLGIAKIWLDANGHIVQGTTQLNDSYFNTSYYNNAPWRQLVMCQEIAHDFGLGHQDENFNNANLGSCMDYTNDPDGGAGGASPNDASNEHPNAHDFEELLLIYDHVDGALLSSPGRGNGNGNGAERRSDQADAVLADLPPGASPENGSVYVTDLGGGRKLITHVFWIERGRGN